MRNFIFKSRNLLKLFITIGIIALVITGCGGGGGGDGGGGGGDDSGVEPLVEKFSLTVDKFGDGTISSDVSGIDCGNDCTESYKSNTSIILTAMADPGSEFLSWTGCDFVSGINCTVSMNSNRTILPTFGLKELLVPNTTKVLSDETMQYLLQTDGETFYFSSQATELTNVNAGDVIVSENGEGLLKKVTEITTLTDGRFKIKTIDASLQEAIEKGTISFSQNLTTDDVSSSTLLTTGVGMKTTQSPEEFSFSINKEVAGVTITGNVTINPTICFDATFDNFSLEEFRTYFIVDTIENLTVDTYDLTTADNVWPIYQGEFQPQVVWIYGFPVVYRPVFTVYLGINASADNISQNGVRAHIKYTAGLYYKKGADDLTPKSDFFKEFTPEISTDPVNLNFKAYISPEFFINIYEVAGPYATLEGYLRASYDLEWLRLYAGLSALIGGRVPFFKKIGLDFDDFEKELYNQEWLISEELISVPNQAPTANITSPPNGSSYNQGNSITFNGSGSDPEDGPLSGNALVWTSSIDGKIGTGTSFTINNLSLGNHTISLTATDSEGAKDTSSINITIISVGPINIKPTIEVNQPSSNISVKQGTSVNISWDGTDPDDDTVTVTLFYDTDNNLDNGGFELIGSSSSKDGTYSWDTSSVSLGTYYIIAVIDDGHGDPDPNEDVAPGRVTINSPANVKPTIEVNQPSSNISVTQGTSVTISWGGTDPDDDTVTVTLFYDTDNNLDNGGFELIGSSSSKDGTYSWNTSSVSLGTYYIIAVIDDGHGDPDPNEDVAPGRVTIGNVKPTIVISQPTSNITVSQGGTVNIVWNGTDPDDTATVNLFYDTDTNLDNGGWGTISLGRPEDGSYSWNTSGVPSGTYYIIGVIDDGNHGTDVGKGVAPGRVTIGNVKPTIVISQPTSNITVSEGGTVNIVWNGTDPDDAATVNLFYDTDTNLDNGGWGMISLGRPEDGSYSWNTSGVPSGTYYIIGVIDDGNHGTDVGKGVAPGRVTIN